MERPQMQEDAYHRYRMCDRKRKFPGHGSARKFAKRHGMKCYACPYCHGWHVSTRS